MQLRQKTKILLIALIAVTFLVRLHMLNTPKSYVFDEVYHGFTAKEYLKGSREAWEWRATPPPGVAFEWTHPPLAKEIMSLSMIITGSTDPWAWRIPGVILGTLNVFLVFLLAKQLFNNDNIALTAAYLFAFDGLNFVQSRTGMNDVYLVFFVLLSLIFLLRKSYFISAIFIGLALSSKWTTFYFYPILLIILSYQNNLFVLTFTKNLKVFFTTLFSILKIFALFIIIPVTIYLLSYIPFFYLEHNFNQFIELQQQMWWYHTGLKATHTYASAWWSWPLNLYPVWYFVEYTDTKIANIFASGNPIVFVGGFIAIILSTIDYLKKPQYRLFVILLAYYAFWLPWALSPRIMFLYHYTPTIPFLCIALSYQLHQANSSALSKTVLYLILIITLVSFLLIYPFLTGVLLPKESVQLFFWTNATKNPFSY